MKCINVAKFNSHENRILANDDSMVLEYWYRGNMVYDGIEYTRDEAIAAARAILAFYGDESQ